LRRKKTSARVKKLIAGPTVYIRDESASNSANDIIAEE
jgi:hypothetical protein